VTAALGSGHSTPVDIDAARGFLSARNGGDAGAFVSDFSQTFSQTIVPEPASLIPIGSNLFGIGVLGRMKGQA